MPVTIIGQPVGAPFPIPYAAPTVSSKNSWSDPEWAFEPDLDVVSFTVNASSGRPDSANVSTRYGNVKKTFDDDFAALIPMALIGCWIRISLISPHGYIMQFVGLVESSAVRMTGGIDSEGFSLPSGRQQFVASGGLKILQKIVVSEAVFLNADDSTSKIGWVPAMNQKDKRGLLVGNRSTDLGPGNTYYYGGSDVWSHGDYLFYLLTNFIQQPGGPTWTIGGQKDVLDTMKTTIKFSETANVAEMLRELIPVRYGLDFFVKPTEAGFEISVFSLTGAGEAVAGVSMPANPNTVQIIKNNETDLIETHIVDSMERKVDTIQVVGKRIVVCGSLFGPNSIGNPNLVPKWSPAIEADYLVPLGAVADDYDAVRKNERYRDVYQHLGAPADWDMGGGAWAVKAEGYGVLSSSGIFQTTIRETLSYIPLKEGFDYSTDPPTDNTLGAPQTSDVKPPMAFIYNPDPDEGSPRYMLAHQLGIHVHKPYMDWGIVLDASPNHLLGLGHFDDGGATSDIPPKYDYETAVCTIAIESDHRIQLSYKVPADQAAGDGSVMTIMDAEAECWVMLAGTVVDCDPQGNLATSGSVRRVLRNDQGRLALVLAGAVSKYKNDRVRAQLTFKGFQPWAPLLGQILTVVQQGDDAQPVGAPITSVEWICMPSPTMILKTGYA